jgi:hypothetical protein
MGFPIESDAIWDNTVIEAAGIRWTTQSYFEKTLFKFVYPT